MSKRFAISNDFRGRIVIGRINEASRMWKLYKGQPNFQDVTDETLILVCEYIKKNGKVGFTIDDVDYVLSCEKAHWEEE